MGVRLAVVLVCVAACGGRTAATTATTDADATDAGESFPFDGAVPCGATQCGPGAVCVATNQSSGPAQLPNDAGACPAKTVEMAGQCLKLTFRCTSKPATCTHAVGCDCIEMCAGDAICSCRWPPMSQQFLCNCGSP